MNGGVELDGAPDLCTPPDALHHCTPVTAFRLLVIRVVETYPPRDSGSLDEARPLLLLAQSRFLLCPLHGGGFAVCSAGP